MRGSIPPLSTSPAVEGHTAISESSKGGDIYTPSHVYTVILASAVYVGSFLFHVFIDFRERDHPCLSLCNTSPSLKMLLKLLAINMGTFVT